MQKIKHSSIFITSAAKQSQMTNAGVGALAEISSEFGQCKRTAKMKRRRKRQKSMKGTCSGQRRRSVDAAAGAIKVIRPDHRHGRLAYRTTWMQLPPAEELYEFELSKRNKLKCDGSPDAVSMPS